MSGRGTTDGIYIVKCIHQITDKMKNLADALLINLVAALDYVNKDVMFKTDFQRFTPYIRYETDPTDGITIFAYKNRSSSNSWMIILNFQ